MTEQNNMTADERYCFDCIHNEVCLYCPHDGCDFKETLNEAAKSDTDEAELDKGWISVDERLPENETEVLIYCPELVCTIKLAMWIEDGFYVDNEDLIVKAEPNGYCTHWLPLPEPPKGE